MSPTRRSVGSGPSAGSSLSGSSSSERGSASLTAAAAQAGFGAARGDHDNGGRPEAPAGVRVCAARPVLRSVLATPLEPRTTPAERDAILARWAVVNPARRIVDVLVEVHPTAPLKRMRRGC